MRPPLQQPCQPSGADVFKDLRVAAENQAGFFVSARRRAAHSRA
jgi:hypothetical protein